MSSTKIVLLLLVSLMMQLDQVLSIIKIKMIKNSVSNGPLRAGAITNTNSYYTVPIILGTPIGAGVPQTFNVLVDTGKTDFWVVDRFCPDALCVLPNRPFYQGPNSATYTNKAKSVSVNYFYNSYKVTGVTTQDRFVMDDVTITGQDFIRATKATKFTTEPIDGIMGLAYNPTITTDTRQTPFERMVSQNLVTNKIFGILLTAVGGTLTLGAAGDAFNPATLFYANVISGNKGTWTFRATRIIIGTTSTVIESNGANVRIESILPNIGAPKASIKKIATALGTSNYDSAKKVYIVDCDILDENVINLVLIVNGQTLTIPPATYILSDGAGIRTCTLNLSEQSGWILGQTFLQAFYTIYDATNGKIGFANY